MSQTANTDPGEGEEIPECEADGCTNDGTEEVTYHGGDTAHWCSEHTTTTVRLFRETIGRMKEYGYPGDSHDDVVNRMVDRIEILEEQLAGKEARIRELEREG